MNLLRAIEECDPGRFEEIIEDRDEPAVFRGLVGSWPVVAAARKSDGDLADYLTSLDRGATIRAFVGDPADGGRFFYSDDLLGFNFGVTETKLMELVNLLLQLGRDQAIQPIYMGSTSTAEILPAFAAQNPLRSVEQLGAEPRAWIGNGSRIAVHFDESDNVACVVSGMRRFTLFPTDQVENLYVGPLERTVAGQPTSLVDLAAPDFGRFPKFREALKHARTAELGPGDAIYIPCLWWHGVEAVGPLNLLVNYWWHGGPVDFESPMHALGHGLLAISPLAKRKRERWRTLFDHYVFQRNGDPAEHLPPAARGILGRSNAELRRFVRQFLIQKLMGR
ncbi:MAG TPA: cupin-like domain-containing protein [Sphingomicrobium sp.]